MDIGEALYELERVLNQNSVEVELRYFIPHSLINTDRSVLKTLTFNEAGVATRICLQGFGYRPFTNYTVDPGGVQLDYRRVLWNAARTRKVEEVAAKLTLAGITDFILKLNVFEIHIPADSYVTSFYKSADPLEWKKINSHKVELRKINVVERRLDRR